jgi:hypothetical protein
MGRRSSEYGGQVIDPPPPFNFLGNILFMKFGTGCHKDPLHTKIPLLANLAKIDCLWGGFLSRLS